MRVKICGITRLEDALVAVEAGADALGFVFVPASPRCLPASRAHEIIRRLPPGVLTVGVFVDQDRETVEHIIRDTGIHAIQLHGNETPDETRGYKALVIKAHRVFPGFKLDVLDRFTVHAHLLDTFVENMGGGTGKTFDWEIARQARVHGDIILSGGLHPENVAEAIRRSSPAAVDVSSGVEREPGIKNAVKMRDFVRNALGAFEQLQ
jgi:phosphoribosylanthranilate isomerase